MNLDVVSHGQIICICVCMYCIRSAGARLQCAKSQSHRKSRLKHSTVQFSKVLIHYVNNVMIPVVNLKIQKPSRIVSCFGTTTLNS